MPGLSFKSIVTINLSPLSTVLDDIESVPSLVSDFADTVVPAKAKTVKTNTAQNMASNLHTPDFFKIFIGKTSLPSITNNISIIFTTLLLFSNVTYCKSTYLYVS